jgi:hypothetical protein
MIYHEMFSQHLRAGNWLFKYAWSIAKKAQLAEITAYPENYYLWQYLSHPPHTSTPPQEFNFLKVNWEWSKEEELRVDKVLKENRNTLVSLDSFFQSEKWFENYRHLVRSSLYFSDKAESDVIWKYGDLFLTEKPKIGIGVRLGDFIGHGDFHQIDPDWYISALNTHFPNWETENTVVVFSDDVVTAKEIFKEFDFKYPEPNGTHVYADNFKHYHGDASEQLILGTLMNHFIIGNSTFSWWQAWLATYNSGKVVHCGKVFSETGNMKHINTKDYYPSNWIKHENQNL